MKKTIICGLACLSMASMPTFGAFAATFGGDPDTGYFTGTRDAYVGEIDETVYSVDLNWGSMTFDWKYAKDLNRYRFESSRTCDGVIYKHDDNSTGKQFETGGIYSDANCTTVIEDEPADGTIVHVKENPGSWVSVKDNSTNGKVKVLASFTPTQKYDWVTGEFVAGGSFTDGSSLAHMNISKDNQLEVGTELYYYFGESYGDGVIPTLDSARAGVDGMHYAHLMLRTKAETDLSNVDIATHDSIGRVTINIEPDME